MDLLMGLTSVDDFVMLLSWLLAVPFHAQVNRDEYPGGSGSIPTGFTRKNQPTTCLTKWPLAVKRPAIPLGVRNFERRNAQCNPKVLPPLVE
jgi:hypothetical protein